MWYNKYKEFHAVIGIFVYFASEMTGGLYYMAIIVPEKYTVPLYLFHQGENSHAYEFFGSHRDNQNGKAGAVFRVWAPHARSVSVVGDFNHWDRGRHPTITSTALRVRTVSSS